MSSKLPEFTVKDSSYVGAILNRARSAIEQSLLGGPVVLMLARISKSRIQEKKYHAMLNDIARQVVFDGGKRYKLLVWKARMVEQFAHEKAEMGEPLRHPGQTIMSMDGERVITVRPSTKQFIKNEAADFIEFLYVKGSEMRVQWSEPALRAYQEYWEAS